MEKVNAVSATFGQIITDINVGTDDGNMFMGLLDKTPDEFLKWAMDMIDEMPDAVRYGLTMNQLIEVNLLGNDCSTEAEYAELFEKYCKEHNIDLSEYDNE